VSHGADFGGSSANSNRCGRARVAKITLSAYSGHCFNPSMRSTSGFCAESSRVRLMMPSIRPPSFKLQPLDYPPEPRRPPNRNFSSSHPTYSPISPIHSPRTIPRPPRTLQQPFKFTRSIDASQSPWPINDLKMAPYVLWPSDSCNAFGLGGPTHYRLVLDR
jgi:hypothetical protein